MRRIEDINMLNATLTRRAALLLTAIPLLPRSAFAAWPPITVHKDPNCGCCTGWVSHMELNGFHAKVIETTSLNRVKAGLGVPLDIAGCHTAEVGGYVIEGHVPAIAVKKFLNEKPQAIGLSVPGMPNGSPGMTGDYEEYDVILFSKTERRVYGRFKGESEV
jgi:hypothetical protein